ncbi:hypothetical protein ACPOL_5416 [Acidisarcina polymorpha]|uniref:Uncharacterized protein n=1 Tax=Acidisarcina polymorpha TaxID=2211140 RepID=A0A2Z5G7I1_9BACT|nr:hypothetical protein ACPOL_5416 [Acidisarcina polymorpha]
MNTRQLCVGGFKSGDLFALQRQIKGAGRAENSISLRHENILVAE